MKRKFSTKRYQEKAAAAGHVRYWADIMLKVFVEDPGQDPYTVMEPEVRERALQAQAEEKLQNIVRVLNESSSEGELGAQVHSYKISKE